MNALKMNPFPMAAFVFSLTLLCVSPAVGSVVELYELEKNLPGRVFVYLPDVEQTAVCFLPDAMENEIPRRHPLTGRPFPYPGLPTPALYQLSVLSHGRRKLIVINLTFILEDAMKNRRNWR